MCRKIMILMIVVIAIITSNSSASEPNDYIIPGKSYMVEGTLSGIRLAYETFDNGINDQACVDCNADRELRFLHAVTRLAMLFIDNNDVTMDSFLELAQKFGVNVTGDYLFDVNGFPDANDLVHVNVLVDANGFYQIPVGAPNDVEVGEIIKHSIIPEINDIINELDSIDDSPSNRFRIFFKPTETGLTNDLEVDYGEVLVLKGLLLAFKAQLEAELAYDIFVDVNEVLVHKLLYEDGINVNDGNKVNFASFFDVNDPNNPNINQDFLDRYPYLLTVLPTPGHDEDGPAILAQAAQDWVDAINYYFNAIDYIRSEDDPSGTDPQEDELLYIDPNDKDVLDNVDSRLTTLRDSLINDTVGTYSWETSNTYHLEDPSSVTIWELTLNYDIVGLPTDEPGSFVASGDNSIASPWEIMDISVDGNEIILEMDYDMPGYWGGALFTGILSEDSNHITNGVFEYWGPAYGTVDNLSGQLVSTNVTERQLDLNPIFGSSSRYPDPVSPRNLLPEFDVKNVPISGTFGHGLGDDPTLGGILPGMTQEEWAILFDLPVPGLQFDNIVRISVGDIPSAVILVDINKDGVLDIITANAGSNDISVLLGLGKGSFSQQKRFVVGTHPESVVVGDLNGDGKLDIVAANTVSNDISVLLGLGNGDFQDEIRYDVGNNPVSVVLGDLNGDGILDVVTANIEGADVSVLLGLGDGSFGTQVKFSVGNGPHSVALGDLNSDGYLDIVTADSWSNTISVLLGLGDGSFQPRMAFEVGAGPHSVTLGDLNGDGVLDIITANRWSGDISVLLGLGDGDFERPSSFDAGGQPQSLSLGDINGDGIPDVVVANSGDESVSLLLGVGDGNFGRQSRFDVGNEPEAVAVGDLNGDGVLDIVSTGPSDVGVLFNKSLAFGHYPFGTTTPPVDEIRIRFPYNINPLSFSIGDDIVSFAGPHGSIKPDSSQWLDAKTLEIKFDPQSAYGTYTLIIGPNILDTSDRAMDVDHDLVTGEIPDDWYIASFNLPGYGDLVVTSVDVQGTPIAGRPLHIAWDVLNNDSNDTTSSGFLDAVYLSSDQYWDIGDVYLGALQHNQPLGPEQSYHAEMDVMVPGTMPGTYYVLVRTDPSNQVGEPNGEDNNITASNPVAVDVQELIIGTPTNESFTETELYRYFKVTVVEGEDLKITLDDINDIGTNELYTSFETVPTRSQHDYHYTTNFAPDQTIRVPGTHAGTYYTLAYAGSIDDANSLEFNIQAEYLPMEIYHVDPNNGWNESLFVTALEIKGAIFDEGAAVMLHRTGETDINPIDTTYIDTGTIQATFDLSGVTPGIWDLRVINPGSELVSFPFNVIQGGVAKLETHLVLPSALAANRRAVLYIEYTNIGNAPMAAPLLKFHGSQNAMLTADSSLDGPGLWTDNPPPGLMDTVQVLALGPGSDVGILNPGDSGQIPIYYRGLKLPWDWTRPPIKFTLGILTADNNTPIDWEKFESEIYPSGIDPNEWDLVFAQLQGQIGSTWGDYVTAMTNNAKERAQYGVITYDVRTLFNDELQEAYGKDQGVIGGHVRLTDAGGDVANATIIASQVDANDVVFGATNVNGRFFIGNLSPGLYELTVDDYFLDSPVQVNVTEGQDPCSVELTVRPGGVITGYVQTENYQWTTNALITAISTTGEVFTATASWGYYQIDGLPAGTYTVRCEMEPYVTAEKTDISVEYGQTTWLPNFMLAPGGTITGTVIDTNSSTPVEGAHVFAVSQNDQILETETNKLGEYSITGISSGSWNLFTRASGYTESNTVDVNILAPDTVIIDLLIPPAATISGRVQDTEGNPIEGASVLAFDGGEVSSGITDETGSYIIWPVSLSSYKIVATHPDYSFEIADILVDHNEITHHITTANGKIHGIISDIYNSPLENVIITITSLNDIDLRHIIMQTVSSADGSYSFENLADANYLILAEGAGFGRTLTTRNMSDNSNIQLDLQLPQEIILSGKVIDLEIGEPIVDSGIFISNTEYSGKDSGIIGVSDQEGNYQLTGLTNGQYEVWVVADNYVSLQKYISLSDSTFMEFSLERQESSLNSIINNNASPTTPPLIPLVRFVLDTDRLNPLPDPERDINKASSPKCDNYDLLARYRDLMAKPEGDYWQLAKQAYDAQIELSSIEGLANDLKDNYNNAVVNMKVIAWGRTLNLVLPVSIDAYYEAKKNKSTWEFLKSLFSDGLSKARKEILKLFKLPSIINLPFYVMSIQEAGYKIEAISNNLRSEALDLLTREIAYDNYVNQFHIANQFYEEKRIQYENENKKCDNPNIPDPNTEDGDDGSSDNIGSYDPNKKIGRKGFGSGGFIVADPTATVYTIYFENEPNATASALEVHIEDQLDSDLDWTSFELLEIGFGPYQVTIPSGMPHYKTSMEINGWTWSVASGWHTGETPLKVDIEADIDITTGNVTWDIVSYDPRTGWEPEDAYAGFLPPNDLNRTTHRGEGYVSFRIRPKAGLPTGTQITNDASITFDVNPPIETPQTLNTIDAGPPNSNVLSLPTVTSEPHFLVEWTGQDDTGGSGIAYYDIFVSVDGAPFTLWQSKTGQTSAVFTGESGHSYAFYSIATDNVGHIEQSPPQPDATTTVVTSRAPVANAGPDQTAFVGAECTAEVTLDGSDSNDPDDDGLSYSWSLDGGEIATGVNPIIELPLGANTITLVVSDGTESSEPDEVLITVADNTSPELTVSVTPNTLWPPNHKMVLITPAITKSDNCDQSTTVTLLSITMNEGEETDTFDPEYDYTQGDGHTLDDIHVDSDGNIYLRAERSGKGNGRVYAITYKATDDAGNETQATATVTVPHSQP